MSEKPSDFERLLGHAALRLWSELPREVQEKLFETAVPLDPSIRNRLATFLHDRHPRTVRPPGQLCWLSCYRMDIEVRGDHYHRLLSPAANCIDFVSNLYSCLAQGFRCSQTQLV